MCVPRQHIEGEEQYLYHQGRLFIHSAYRLIWMQTCPLVRMSHRTMELFGLQLNGYKANGFIFLCCLWRCGFVMAQDQYQTVVGNTDVPCISVAIFYAVV